MFRFKFLSVRNVIAATVVAGIFGGFSMPAHASKADVEKFYSKNDISIIVYNSAGGSNDTLARMLAPHLMLISMQK